VVIEHRVYPLLPLGALVHQRVTAPHMRAQVQRVRRRDPRLREPADQQQLTQMPGIRPAGLRALPSALQTARLRRLSQMRVRADPLELLNHKPPARRCLARDLELRASNRVSNSRTAPRSAGAILARETSPVIVSIDSAEICSRC
jgi:hypothetical protein